MASSPTEFFILRRYSNLTARCLLSLQHGLAKKEEELDAIDSRSIEEQLGFSYLDSLDNDSFARRLEVLQESAVMLREYCTSTVGSVGHLRLIG